MDWEVCNLEVLQAVRKEGGTMLSSSRDERRLNLWYFERICRHFSLELSLYLNKKARLSLFFEIKIIEQAYLSKIFPNILNAQHHHISVWTWTARRFWGSMGLHSWLSLFSDLLTDVQCNFCWIFYTIHHDVMSQSEQAQWWLKYDQSVRALLLQREAKGAGLIQLENTPGEPHWSLPVLIKGLQERCRGLFHKGM